MESSMNYEVFPQNLYGLDNNPLYSPHVASPIMSPFQRFGARQSPQPFSVIQPFMHVPSIELKKTPPPDQKCFEDLPLQQMWETHPDEHHQVAVKVSQQKRPKEFRMDQVQFRDTNQTLFQTPQQPVRSARLEQQYFSDKVRSRRLQFSPARKFSDDDGLKGRSQKGRLRSLSLKVKEIVAELRETTYKQVAEKLIEQLDVRNACTPKDEQNIKRRVYDALNVMIASGVLRKENKKVLCDNLSRGTSKSDLKRQEHQALESDVEKKVASVAEKKRKLNELFNYVSCLDHLHLNNMHRYVPETDRIYFPLMTFHSEKDKVNFEMKGFFLKINSAKLLSLQSDLSVLVKLNDKQLPLIRQNHPLFSQITVKLEEELSHSSE